MKVSKNSNRIVGLIATEVSINILGGPEVAMTAGFALLDEDGAAVAKAVRKQWSPRVQEALTALVDVLETDAMESIFGAEPTEDLAESTTASPKDIPTF